MQTGLRRGAQSGRRRRVRIRRSRSMPSAVNRSIARIRRNLMRAASSAVIAHRDFVRCACGSRRRRLCARSLGSASSVTLSAAGLRRSSGASSCRRRCCASASALHRLTSVQRRSALGSRLRTAERLDDLPCADVSCGASAASRSAAAAAHRMHAHFWQHPAPGRSHRRGNRAVLTLALRFSNRPSGLICSSAPDRSGSPVASCTDAALPEPAAGRRRGNRSHAGRARSLQLRRRVRPAPAIRPAPQTQVIEKLLAWSRTAPDVPARHDDRSLRSSHDLRAASRPACSP